MPKYAVLYADWVGSVNVFDVHVYDEENVRECRRIKRENHCRPELPVAVVAFAKDQLYGAVFFQTRGPKRTRRHEKHRNEIRDIAREFARSRVPWKLVTSPSVG